MPYVVVGVLFACGTKDNVNFSLAPDSKIEISILDLSVDTLYLDSFWCARRLPVCARPSSLSVVSL